jgi:hypothetical protein
VLFWKGWEADVHPEESRTRTYKEKRGNPARRFKHTLTPCMCVLHIFKRVNPTHFVCRGRISRRKGRGCVAISSSAWIKDLFLRTWPLQKG